MGKLVCILYIESETHTTLWQLHNECASEQCNDNGNINTFQWNSQFQSKMREVRERINEQQLQQHMESPIYIMCILYYVIESNRQTRIESDTSQENWSVYMLRLLCHIFYIGVFNITLNAWVFRFSAVVTHSVDFLEWISLDLNHAYWKPNQL